MDSSRFFIAEISHVEGDYLGNDDKNIYHLATHKNEEPRMIPSPDTAIDPWTMVIVSFDTASAYVAVIASWYLDDFAFKTQFMNGEFL